ncbi:MAG: hypothetical protein GY760_02225 [Deltaproteobacteria bacterium]|nr:hypothetical protein [Deltaproteobacteria bacterium]
MEEDLKHLLFKRIVINEDGRLKPLYKSQTELAKDIEDSSSNKYGSKESLRPVINQVFKYDGEKSGRPLSAELRSALIVTSIEKLKRIGEKMLVKSAFELKNNFEIEFDTAYEVLKKKNKIENYTSDDIEFGVLKKWQENSNRAVVFTREPLEVKFLDEENDDFDGKPKELIKIVIDNLLKNYSIPNSENEITLADLSMDLLSEEKTIDLKRSNIKDQFFFRYYVSSFNVAKKLWQGLIMYIINEINGAIDQYNLEKDKKINPFDVSVEILQLFNGSKELLEKLNNNTILDKETGFLKVFKTEGHLLTIPVAYYECADGIKDLDGGNIKHEMLFTLLFDEDDGKKSVSMIEDSDLEFWKEHVYYPLYWSDSIPFKTEDISLEKTISHIKRTTIKNIENGK